MGGVEVSDEVKRLVRAAEKMLAAKPEFDRRAQAELRAALEPFVTGEGE